MNTKKHLIALDLDGTLLADNKTILPFKWRQWYCLLFGKDLKFIT